MTLEVNRLSESILDFLVEAKRQTYAAQGDDATVTPIFPRSRQLEYRSGSLFYRDVYFGVAYFVGQETIYDDERPYWSMSYAGGVDKSIRSTEQIRNIYAFLRAALRQVSKEYIFRGASLFNVDDLEYRNTVEGDFNAFHGVEVISQNRQILYSLHYSGGVIR